MVQIGFPACSFHGSPQERTGLTIHSSRRRFAARLNSGVRPQERVHGDQEDSSAETAKTAGPNAKHANAQAPGQDQVGSRSLALGLFHPQVGMGLGPLEQVAYERGRAVEREHTVQVWNQPQQVTVYQKSKSVWVAVGSYMGERVEVTGRSETQALGNWREAARYRGG